jgi:hypothetical protein
MVLHNGFDGPAEEMHHNGAAAGSERGYHVLTFDGPGHAAARHLEGLVFRSDWENVVTPVLDWVMAPSTASPSSEPPFSVTFRAAGPKSRPLCGPHVPPKSTPRWRT